MVLAELQTTTQVTSKIYYDASPRQWWANILAASNAFFQIIESPELMLQSRALPNLIDELQDIYRYVANQRPPSDLRHLKTYLLAAMGDLLKGYIEYEQEGDALALAYLKSAQFEMQFVCAELKDLRKKQVLT